PLLHPTERSKGTQLLTQPYKTNTYSLSIFFFMSLFHSNPENEIIRSEFHIANLGSFSPLTQKF
ncbi:MAG: hypothetical protein K2F98_08025, partial [Bacteroides sp.]|nr:hypothetical protein [Bacteroides sp.]